MRIEERVIKIVSDHFIDLIKRLEEGKDGNIMNLKYGECRLIVGNYSIPIDKNSFSVAHVGLYDAGEIGEIILFDISMNKLFSCNFETGLEGNDYF